MQQANFAENLEWSAGAASGATSVRQPTRLTSIALTSDANRLFAVAAPTLLWLARLNGATTDQAEDIAQETLLTAWRSFDHLRDSTRFDGWLDGICRNICRRVARQRADENAHMALLAFSSTTGAVTDQTDLSLHTPLDDIAADTQDPLDELSRQELVTLVESALGYLNLAAREAVSLRYLDDLPADEAAARLGLSLNVLEARLSRARKQLRAALNGPLRERAVEFGLALAPPDETGWRETSIWCHFCGDGRVLWSVCSRVSGYRARPAP
jgi:RNA polymerase sigma factor (sigma-70 family)